MCAPTHKRTQHAGTNARTHTHAHARTHGERTHEHAYARARARAPAVAASALFHIQYSMYTKLGHTCARRLAMLNMMYLRARRARARVGACERARV